METAIETLQDRIIYLTGQIALTSTEDIDEYAKKSVISTWEKQIEELKEAQSILSQHNEAEGEVFKIPEAFPIGDLTYPGIDLSDRTPWIYLSSIEPKIEDVPFVTRDKDGLYEVWDDSDWFDEIIPEGRITEYTSWKRIQQKLQSDGKEVST